jgi:hypothetical protein
MTDHTTPDPQDFGLATFGEMLWRRVALPGEEPGSFELFREGITRDLEPMTPYEAVIADHLVMVEWEIREQRRMRDAAIRARMLEAARELVLGVREREHQAAWGAMPNALSDGSVEKSKAADESEPFDVDAAHSEGDALARRLGSGDPDELAQADRILASLGTSRIELMAAVWQTMSALIDQHEEMIRDLERRRREVQKDLEQLQRKRPFEGTASR